MQFTLHRPPSLVLLGHNESAPDITVLDKTFAILCAQTNCQLKRGGTTGIGHRNHRINIVAALLFNFLRKHLAHTHPRFVNEDIVNN